LYIKLKTFETIEADDERAAGGVDDAEFEVIATGREAEPNSCLG
jgi:hypothetical protein